MRMIARRGKMNKIVINLPIYVTSWGYARVSTFAEPVPDSLDTNFVYQYL